VNGSNKNTVMGIRVFHEKQRFDQWWLWLIIAACSVVIFFEPALTFYRKKSISLGDLNVGFWIGITITLLIVLLFRFLTLETEINENGVTYQFYPFHRNKRHIDWNNLKKIYVRKYRPISEYGGWGYRVGLSGVAYNIKGNQGIQLKFKSGKKLLIGTQKPKEAQQIINKYFKNERI